MSTSTKPPETFASPTVDDRGRGDASWIQVLFTTRATYIFLLNVVLIAVFAALTGPAIFLGSQNIQSLLLNGTQALILALGLSLMLGGGKFDLSLGANLVLSSVVGARVVQGIVGGSPENIAVAVVFGFVACLLTGAIFGAVNGVLIAYFGMNSLIATLGTLGIGTGLALVIGGGADIGGMPPIIQTGFGLAKIFGVPTPAILALVLAAILWFVVRFTRFGLRTVAIGSSSSAALRAGIRVKQHLLVLAIIAGLFAGLAGFMDLATFGSTSINGHANAALAAATAVVIGGTSIEGGRISITGTVWGAALAVILQTGLVIAGVSSAYQLIAVGAVLLIAVGLDRLSYVRRVRS